MSEMKDIDALRAQLDGTRGKEYWRSLEALSGTPEFKDFLHREFPQNASPEPVTIATSTESSSRKSAHVEIINRWTSGSMAFLASGRLIVT